MFFAVTNKTIDIPKIDVDGLTFNDNHINNQRHHNISEQDAKNYIRNAKAVVIRWNGMFYNFYSDDGAAYVDMQNHNIHTAFSSEEFDPKTQAFIEELNKYAK